MPTVGWIIEDAIERFWEAHPVATFPRPAPQRFVCRACSNVFTSAEELRRHYGLRHPVALPALHICGDPLPRSSALRARMSEEDVELVQCTSCEVQVDGGAWRQMKPREFGKRLAQCDSGTWNVRLLHERSEDGSRIHDDYHIRVLVADLGQLDAVDEEFVRRLVREDLKHADLAEFQAELPKEMAAREYGAALGDYALGVLLKERKEERHFQNW